ncbi:hypothetical protein CR513_35855, partial [Mucuna pruriens]
MLTTFSSKCVIAVVDAESDENWMWFIEIFRDTFKNTKLVNIFWNAVYVLTAAEFESKNAQMMEISQDVISWFQQFPPYLWVVAYFDSVRYGHFTLGDMRMRWTSILLPSAEKRILEAIVDAHCYQVLRANEVEFEIVSTERTNIMESQNSHVKIMISASLTVGSDSKFDNKFNTHSYKLGEFIFAALSPHWRVVSKLSGLKGVLLVRIIKGKTNRIFMEDTSLSDHLNEFQRIIDQMLGMGIKFEYEILGLLLLNSLPESWETFKVSITNSIPNGVVSLQMVKGSVLNKETRRKTQSSSSQSEENKGKKGKLKEKDDDDDDRVTTATGDDLVILRDFESVNLLSDESMWIIDSGAKLMWIIDSGAKLHVTLRKEFFTSYTSGDFGVLKMGNDDVTKVIDVGDVCLQTNTGMQLWLRGVKHTPDVRKLWVYTLKSKDKVLEKFKHFQALVERQSGKKVKCIRSDNGGEYCGPFDVYCKQQGIRHEKTPPKTPQLNGLAERINMTLIDRIRCMLFEASPTIALNTEVLNKIWFGKDVKYDYLRVFGCKAFMHVPNDERSKLDMKTRQCIFIGYGHD